MNIFSQVSLRSLGEFGSNQTASTQIENKIFLVEQKKFKIKLFSAQNYSLEFAIFALLEKVIVKVNNKMTIYYW